MRGPSRAAPRLFAALLLAAAVAPPSPAAAQSLSSGAIGGRVVSEAGEPLRAVAITLADATTGVGRRTETRADGTFDLLFLAPGTYELRIELLGYTPKVVRAVSVGVERTAHLDLELRSASPPFADVDTAVAAAAAAKSRASAAEPLWDRDWRELPDAGRDAAQLLRVGTLGGVTGGALASPLLGDAGAYVDGFRVRAGARLPLPLSALSAAELAAGPVDVEYAGATTPMLVLHTVRGGNRISADALGAFSGGGLFSSPDFDPGSASPSQLRGMLRVGGPVVGDSAQAALAFEVDRGTAPIWADFAAADAAAQWRGAAAARGLNLDGFAGTRGLTSNTARGFGRLDWQLAEGHELSARGFLSSETLPPAARRGDWLSGAAPVESSAFGGLAGLTSQFAGGFANELRVQAQRTVEEPGLALDTLGVPTFFVPLGAGVSGIMSGFGRTAARAVGFSNTVHYRYGSHHLKTGIQFESVLYERQDPRRSEYLFGGADLLSLGTGVFRTRAPTIVPDFSVGRSGFFAQDRWHAATGLDVILGVRYDTERLPNDLYAPHEEWLGLAGLPELTLQPRIRKLSPRAGFVWDLEARGEWVLNGAVGVYHEEFPVALLAEIVARDRGVETGTLVGTAAAWPRGAAASETSAATALTLAAPALDAPRTTRGVLGLHRALGRSTTIGVAFTASTTEFLPRRTDLNLDTRPVAMDQYGRPILAELVKQGELVVPEPGTNRRFRTFDAVHVVQTDASSTHRAASVSLERLAGERLRLIARYTFSETLDDWFGAGTGQPEALLRPTLAAGEIARRETSDFDVPHQAAVAAVFVLPFGGGGLELGAVFQHRSGLPYTPGLGRGVDLGGDGSGTNDPVFVDDALAGMADLLATHACLRNQAGGWAARNSCRSADVQSLDVRAGIGIAPGGRTLQIFAEAVNLIGGDANVIDTTLLRIDPAQPLTRENGTVRVPYLVNANFGQPVVRRASARVLRFGLQFQY